jgi:transcriptional accessory protein Tex/SPT6
VARYKKDATGNLDEDQIRLIVEIKTKAEKLHKAKQTAVN